MIAWDQRLLTPTLDCRPPILVRIGPGAAVQRGRQYPSQAARNDLNRLEQAHVERLGRELNLTRYEIEEDEP